MVDVLMLGFAVVRKVDDDIVAEYVIIPVPCWCGSLAYVMVFYRSQIQQVLLLLIVIVFPVCRMRC